MANINAKTPRFRRNVNEPLDVEEASLLRIGYIMGMKFN